MLLYSLVMRRVILAVLLPPWRPAGWLNESLCCLLLIGCWLHSRMLHCWHFGVRVTLSSNMGGIYERGSDRRRRALLLTEQVTFRPMYLFPHYFAARFAAWTFWRRERGRWSIIDRSMRRMHLLWWFHSSSSFFFPIDPLILWDLFVIN
jgi:hypothetical protein